MSQSPKFSMGKFTYSGSRSSFTKKVSSVAIYSDEETSPRVSFSESDSSWPSSAEAVSRRLSKESIDSYFSSQSHGACVSLDECQPGYILWLRQLPDPENSSEMEKKIMHDYDLDMGELNHPVLVTGVVNGDVECYMVSSDSLVFSQSIKLTAC
jgi:hypothetical protein